jgi:hypothetical protein
MSLTPLNTSSNSFPLNKSPYLSRVSVHGEELKNYTMLAFNPGFALQAAELNEIQELFFLNLNLSQRLNANWIRFNNGQTTPYSAPYWEGLIPLSPDYLTISNTTFGTAASPSFELTYTLSQGWYLYTDKISKLSFWVWNDTTLTETISGVVTTYAGLNTTTSYVDCCQTDDDCDNKDRTLRDASQSSYQDFTCGSSRFKVTVDGTDMQFTEIDPITGNPPNTFSYIFRVDVIRNKVIFPNGFEK